MNKTAEKKHKFSNKKGEGPKLARVVHKQYLTEIPQFKVKLISGGLKYEILFPNQALRGKILQYVSEKRLGSENMVEYVSEIWWNTAGRMVWELHT